MLWILLGTLIATRLFGGGAEPGWVEIAADLVADHVTDSERRDRAEAVFEEMEGVLAEFEKRILELRKEIIEVDLRYHATAEDYRAVFPKLDATWEWRTKRMIDLLYELRKHITREEWEPLSRAVREAIDARAPKPRS
jgi:hypothetical protein